MQGPWVQSVVGKLRSHMPYGMCGGGGALLATSTGIIVIQTATISAMNIEKSFQLLYILLPL